MKIPLLTLASISLVLTIPTSGQITVTNDTGMTTTVDSGPDQSNKATTLTDWSLNGGNTVAVFFSGEGQDLSSATFGGEPMTVVQEVNGGRWTAAIAYLINPTTSTGDIVLTWLDAVNGTAGQNEVAFTPLALGGVGGVVSFDATDSGDLNFSYTTAEDGAYVLGNATNNDFRGVNLPVISGQPDTFEYQSNISANFSTIHGHGDVPTAGNYTDTYSNSESAATVVFGTSSVAQSSFALTITPAVAPASGFDLTWDSQAGKVYSLRSSDDLTGDISTWTLSQSGILATPPTNTLTIAPDETRNFYAVESSDAP